MREALILIALLITWLAVAAVLMTGCPAHAEQAEPYWTTEEIADAVGTLAPWAHQSRRERWARRIMTANARFDFGDSMLLVAMIRKESSFWESIWNGEKRGERGEIGALQIHRTSGWQRVREPECVHASYFLGADEVDVAYRRFRGARKDTATLRTRYRELSARCSFWSGVRLLKHTKEMCGGSYARIVASYGRGKCVSEQAARYYKSARNARRYYCAALGDSEQCDARWPND